MCASFVKPALDDCIPIRSVLEVFLPVNGELTAGDRPRGRLLERGLTRHCGRAAREFFEVEGN